MATGKTIKHAASIPFDAAALLQPDDLPAFLADVLEGDDCRALPVALRTIANVIGMAELAKRTGLSRETLYRTLSDKGNPRLDTLAAILSAFDLRLAVAPLPRKSRKPARVTHA